MNQDVIVIGGGVNGLTAASYMARAGKKVTSRKQGIAIALSEAGLAKKRRRR